MALTQLAPPYPIFTDRDGSPLDNGFLYFGAVNQNPETNPIQVYYDSDLTQPAAQPLRTSNGYVMRNGSPALIYADSQFSVTVRDKNGALVIYSPSGFGVVPFAPFTFATSDRVVKDVATLLADVQFTYSPDLPNTVQVFPGDIIRTLAEGFAYEVAASGATDENVSTAGGVKLYVQQDDEFYNVKAFGAAGDGVTDDTAIIQAAIAASLGVGKNLLIPPGKYVTSSTIKFDSTTLSVNDQQIISLTVEASGATFIHTGTDVAVHIEMSGFAEKEIRGLVIDHTANNNAQGGFLITNSPRTNIRNTYVLCTKPNVPTYYGYQVRVSDADSGTYWLLFDSCGVRPNTGGSGDYCPIGFWWNGAANATTMRNCFVAGTEGLRISPFSPVQTALPGMPNGCVVDGCWFEGNGTAVKIYQDNRVTTRKSPPGFRFVNNRIEAYTIGIDLDDLPVSTSFNDADYPDISHNHFVFITTPISNTNDVPVFFLANEGLPDDAQMPLVGKKMAFRNPFNNPDPVITTYSGSAGGDYHAQFGDAGYASNFDNYLASGLPGPSFNIGRKASGANPGQAIAISSNQIWFKDGPPLDVSNLHHNFQNTGVAYNTTGTWGTISDARFKENIEYLTDADRQSQVDDIRAFKFARYNLIGKEQRMLGVIAQDVEQISPGLVETRLEQDDLPEMKQVKQSIIHQKAVVALQVALDRIDALEQRIAQLEGGSA